MILHHFPESMLYHIGIVLFHFMWQATAVSLTLALILYGFGIASSHKRYALCCFALLLMVVMPILSADLFNDRLLHLSGETSRSTIDTELHQVTYRHSQTLFTKQYRKEPIPVNWNVQASLWIERILPHMALAWMAGLVIMIARHLRTLRVLSGLIRQSSERLEDRWMKKINSLSERAGINRTMHLMKSLQIDAPMVIGWIKPIILVPVYLFTDMRSDHLEMLILHELAHIRRHDHLVNFLQIILETVGFFHPAVWWLSHQIREERELCCDALTLQFCPDHMVYAKSLFSLERLRHRMPTYALGADGGSLHLRIMRILGQPCRPQYRSLLLLFCGPLICLSCFFIPSETLLLPLQKHRLNSDLCVHMKLDGNGFETIQSSDFGIKVYGTKPAEDRHGDPRGALVFDGVNDHIEINGIKAMDEKNWLTISAWVNPESSLNFASWISRAHPNMERSQWRLGYGNGSRRKTGDDTWGLTAYVESPDSMLWHDFWVINEKIPLNTWSLITAVIDQVEGGLHLYKNGRKVCEIDQLIPFSQPNAPLYIGRQLDNQSYFKGKIDDVRIYTRTLTPLEVKAIYLQNG